jgi:hypothetical protein
MKIKVNAKVLGEHLLLSRSMKFGIFNNGSKDVLNDIMKNHTFPSMGTP